MLNKMNEGFNKLIAYIKNSCKTSGSFMASFGVINFAFVVVLAFCIVVVSNLNIFGVFADEGHDYLADYADKNLIATYDISLAQDGSVKAYCYSSTATGTSTRAVILDGQGYALPFNARYSSGTLIKDISGDGTYYSFTDSTLPTVTTQAPSINFNGYGYVVPGENNDYEGNYFCAPWQQISVSSVDNFYVNKDSNIKFTSAAYLFYGFKSLENVDFTGLDFSECTDMKAMFYECQEFNSVSEISSWDTSNVTDMSFMFYNCKYIVDANLNSWNVGNVKYMNGMFSNAGNLKNVYVSDWDTHSLINISNMFYSCSQLLTLDVSNWITGNIVNMCNAFNTSKLATLDVSNWDTHSLVNANNLFKNCQSVTELDVSNWDVSHVTDMSSMFMSCYKVPGLDVSNWDTSNVTIMSNMFNGCKKVKVIDLSNWDVTNVTNIGAMFYECYLIDYLDMSDWDVTNVQSSGSLFTSGDIPDVIKTPKINPHGNLIQIPSPYMHTLDDSTTQVKYFPVTTGTSVTLYKDINKQLLYSDDEAIYYKNSSGVCTVYETNGTTIHSTITCVNTYDIAASGMLNAYLYSNGLLILDGTGDLSSNQTNKLCVKLNETVATTSDSVKKIVASYGGFKPTGTLCKLNYYFSGLSNLEEFYANRMDFSNVQEATDLFEYSFNKNKNNTILDFSHMDLSSCYDISYMFKDAYSEKIDASYLKLLSSDDVECSYLFNNTYTDSTIKDINMSHWENGNNISKLQYAFVGNPKLEKINFEGTDLGKSGANFTYFFKTGLATVNKTNSTFNIKEIILPKSVGSNTIDISFMTTGLCQFDKAGNKLSSTIQNKLIPQGTTAGSVYKLVGTKKLLASGKISAGTLGASIYNADFYNTGLEYTAYSSVTVAPTVYDLNNDGSLKAYYYSDSNTGGGILLFDGEGPLDKTTMPGYITDHGSDIKRILFSDTGFKPSGDMRFLFSGLGSTTKKISFKEDPLCTINLDKLDLSNVTSTKYLFSNSYFDTLVLPSMSTINSFDVESMLSGAKIYGTLDLTDFDFTNKINAEELFSGYNIDSNTASTVNIKLPNSLGIYEDEIDLPDFSGLTNKTWNGAHDAGGYIGIVSGDYHSKLIDNTSVVNTYSITYLKVVDKSIESNLKNGNTFKAALKSLAAQTGNNIQTITFSLTKQTDSQIATYLANGGIQVDDEGYTVMTMSGNTVTVYTSADKIYTNENSSNMFRCETDDETETLLDPELETITTISNLSKLNTSKTTDFEEMFSGLKNLTSITINSSVNWNTSNVTDFSRMFANCEKLSSLTLPSDFVSNTTDYIHTNYMFYGCKALPSIDISGWTGAKYSKVYGMFSGCSSATSITLNKNLITANLDSSSDPEYDADDKRGLQSLFRDCSSLTSINLASANGVTDPFNFSTVTRTDSMFEGCESLTTLTLPSTTKIINTSVVNTESMFSKCEALTTLNLSGCDMANVRKMYEMFSGCKKLSSLTLPNNFITNKITGVDSSDHEEEGLYKLFYYCRNLSSLNLSGSDFSSINNYGRMFYHCDKLNETNVTFPSNGFNSSPYSIEEMLYKSGFETIDLSAMNLSNLVSNQNIINKNNTYDTDSDGDKLKVIILPSNVSNTYKAMVSAPDGKVWMGYDIDENKVGSITYTKLVAREGTDAGKLYKVKLTQDILFTIDGVEYKMQDLKYTWDISKLENGTTKAYYFTTNGGTVVFNSEKLDDLTISDSDREVIHFGGYASTLRGGLFTNETYDSDSAGSGFITGFNSNIIADLETETGYKNLRLHIGSSNASSYTDLIFTPWSFVETCTEYEVKHIVCNNDITVKEYNNLFRGLDNLTGTLDLNKFKLDSSITINIANKDDIFKRAFSYGDNLTIKFNSEINIVPYMGYYDIDERDLGNDIALDFRGCNIGNCGFNDSLYETRFGILINENRLTKVYVPDKLDSNFTIEDLTYFICDNKNYEIDTYDSRGMMSHEKSKNIVMYEAYNDNGTPNDDSDDIFLGYTYHLVDSVHSYDSFTRSVSYLVPKPELDFYASYMAYTDDDFTSKSDAINVANINLFFERIGLASNDNDLFHSQSYTYDDLPYGIIKQDSLKDSEGKFIIPYKQFLEAFERTLYKDSFNAEDFTDKMLSYMKDEIESNGGLDVTIKADLTDSNSNTNDFYLLNKYANEYINKMLNANINKEELDPLYYLDKLTVNVIGLVSDAFSNAFNLIRSNYLSQEKDVKFKLVDSGDGTFYPDDETFIDPSNILFGYGDDFYDGPESDDRCLTFSDSNPDYYIYSGTITPEMDGVCADNTIDAATYTYAIPGYDFTPGESINFDITYEIDFGSGIHFTNSDEYFEINYLDGSYIENYIEYDDSNLVGKKTFTVNYNNYYPVKGDGSPNAEEGLIFFQCYTGYDGNLIWNDLNKPFFTGSYDVTIKIPKKATIVNESNKKYIDETAQADLITNFIYSVVICDLLTNDFSSSDKNIVRETDNYYVIKNPSLVDIIDYNTYSLIMYDLDEEKNIPFYYASTDDISSSNYDTFTAYSITDFKTLFDNGSRILSDSDVETYLKSATIRTSNDFKTYTNKNKPVALIYTTSSTSETYVALPKSVDKLVHVSDNTFSDLLDSIGGILYKVVPKYYLDNDENNIADFISTNKLLVNVNALDISLEDTNPNKDNISVSGYTLDNMYDPNDPDFAITFPDLVVTYTNNKGEDIELVKDTDYSVSYNKNDVAGDSDTSFTITGIGPNVIGSRTINFNINGNMFTIDGINYRYADLKYTWDISKLENNSVKAYFFSTNGGTLVFNTESDENNLVKEYSSNTPWTTMDDDGTSDYVMHVAFNNKIHFTSLSYMFKNLDKLDYIELDSDYVDYESIDNYDTYNSNVFFGCGNITVKLCGDVIPPTTLFEEFTTKGNTINECFTIDFSDAVIKQGNSTDIQYPNYFFIDDLYLDKIYVPSDISDIDVLDRYYSFVIGQNKGPSDDRPLVLTMYEVYNDNGTSDNFSDDIFLGYSPKMIDKNDTSFGMTPTYVKTNYDLSPYASYEAYVCGLDNSDSTNYLMHYAYSLIKNNSKIFDEANYDDTYVSLSDFKDILDSMADIDNPQFINLPKFYNGVINYISHGFSDSLTRSDLHMDLTHGEDSRIDLTDSTNSFYKVKSLYNEYINKIAAPNVILDDSIITPLYYLDVIKLKITNAVSNINSALNNAFNIFVSDSDGNEEYLRDDNTTLNAYIYTDTGYYYDYDTGNPYASFSAFMNGTVGTGNWWYTNDDKYLVVKTDKDFYVYIMELYDDIYFYHTGSGIFLNGESLDSVTLPSDISDSNMHLSSYIESNLTRHETSLMSTTIPGVDETLSYFDITNRSISDIYYVAIPTSMPQKAIMNGTEFSSIAKDALTYTFRAIPNSLKQLKDNLVTNDKYHLQVTVNKLDISDTNTNVYTQSISDKNYTGSAITCDSDVHVYYKNNVWEDGDDPIELEQGTDYTLSYSNNIDAGLATITITGDGVNTTGSRTINFKITRALDLSSVRLLDNVLTSNPNLLDKTYDGNNIVTSLNNLELTSSDNSSIPSNMKVIVNGTYDNSNAGSNKDVTLTYIYKDLSGNDIDTTYYTITDSNVTYKGNISKKKIDVTFNNLDNINKDYDKTSDINIGITCDAGDLVSGDTVSLPSQVHGNFSRVTASQSDSDKINITLDANWYNIDSINANYELDVSDAPSSISGLINKIELDYDFTHSSDSSNPYHYMKVFDNDKTYVGAVGITLDDTNVVSGDNVTINPGLWIEAKSAQKGTYHLHTSDELYIDTIGLYGTDKDNYFIKQPIDKDKFNNLYLEICNKLIDDGGLGTININMLDNTCEYTGNNIDVKSKISIVDKSGMTNYYLNYDTDYIIEYYKDGVKIDNIKDAGSYTIKLIGQGNYSGSKDLTYTVTPKVIHKADIDLAEKDIVKVKNGEDYYPVTFTTSELHLTYTNDLTSPSEVVPIHFTNAYFVRDYDYDEILFFTFENTPTSLRDVKFEGLSIDDTYSNNYVFGDDILSDNYKIVINDANYLIDDIAPTILDITTEEKTYGRGMDICFNVLVSEDIGDLNINHGEFVIKYKIGNSDSNIYEAYYSKSINPDSSVDFDRHGILVFEGWIDEDLDYGLPKDQCSVYSISIESIELTGSSFVHDDAGNNLDLTINHIDGIKPFDINKVNVDTRGFSINLTHTDTSRTSADTFLSEYHLEISDDLYFDEDIFYSDDKKEEELLSKLKFTVTRMKDADSYDDSNPSDSFYTKTYSFSDLYDDGIINYTCNDLLKDYDISIQINYLEFYDFDDSDSELHLGIFRKNDIYGCELKLEIDEDALTNETGNTNIEAKTSTIAIFNAPDFVLDDDNDDLNPNKYFTFVYTDALGDTKNILLAPNGDSTNGYKFINALTGEEVYFYQDDKISILNDIDLSDLLNEFRFDIISDLKGLVLDTPVMNKFGMDAALNIDYVFSDVSNFLRDNVINNIDKSVYDIISDLYLHYDGEEAPGIIMHLASRNNGIKNIILRVRTIDDITRDVLKVINDNSKTDSEKDLLYKFISPTQKDFSIIDPNNDISNYTDSDTPVGTLKNILKNVIDDSGNSFIDGTFAKELDRRNTIKAINKNNLKDTLLDIARDLWKGYLNRQDLINLLDQDPLSDSDIEKAMIAYQKMPSWVVSAYLDNDVNVVPPDKTFGYYIDKLFKLYYGESDDLGNIVTPGVIDGYGSKVSSSDNENFEVFGLINKVDKPNDSDKVFLDVRKITDSNELDDVRSELNNYYLNKSLSFDDKVLTPYDIKLYVKNLSSGNKNFIQPKSGENILVKLELDPLFYYTDFKIYHTTHKDDGTIDEIDSLPLRKDLDLTNNKYYVYFEADSFSTFTITCDAKTIVVSEKGDIDSDGKYLGGSITPNGLIPILNPNVTKTKLFTITLNNDYKAEIYKDFASSPFMTVDSNKMITLDNLDSDSDNIYLLVKYIYDPKVDPADPEPQPEKPKDLSSATITIQVANHNPYINGYSDNTFKPDKYMTRAEFSKIIASVSESFNYTDRDKDLKALDKYTDMDKSMWSARYIGYALTHNIMKGYNDNTFKPNKAITRAEVCKVLSDIYNIKQKDIENIYQNELKGKWYENSMNKLIKGDLLKGYPDGTIKPNNSITRAEVVALINRVKERGVNLEPNLRSYTTKLKDVTEDKWYYYDVLEASVAHSSR